MEMKQEISAEIYDAFDQYFERMTMEDDEDIEEEEFVFANTMINNMDNIDHKMDTNLLMIGIASIIFLMIESFIYVKGPNLERMNMKLCKEFLIFICN